MILVRFALVGLIVYLIIRSFMRFGEEKGPATHIPDPGKKSKENSQGVSKKIGEYVDFEEVDK